MNNGSSITSKIRIPLEETKKIDIQTLTRSGIIHPGKSGTLSWLVDGQSIGAITFRCLDSALEISYQYKHLDGHWQPIKQTVQIAKVTTSHGFAHNRFVCPSCQGKVNELSGFGKYFLCRHCYRFPYGSLRGTAAKYDHLPKHAASMPVSYWEASKLERQRLNLLSLKHCELVVTENSTDPEVLTAG